MASLIGKEIGKYRITERLGQGGMAEVYAGLHTHLDRKVAIKVLHSYLLEGGDFVARFKREAKAVANLRHPNIVQVYDFDIQDDLIFMVMEYIDGVNLHSKLVEVGNRGARMPIKLIGSIINDIASALDYAHSKDMLHRDIKPSNIMIDSENKAYLTDFGIAKLLSDQKFTATGTLVGTPAYMSPEQGLGDDVGKESDIYSLGVVAFEMLTGQVPFDAKTPIGIVHKQINDPVPDMSTLIDGIPKSAQEVIDRALAKAPESRFSTAEDLVGALGKALTGLDPTDPISVQTEEPPTVVDDGLEAPTVKMDAGKLEQPTVVMEEEKPAEEVITKERAKIKPVKEPRDKKKIPIWAYIAGAVGVLAVVGVILTQVLDLDLGIPTSPAAEENNPAGEEVIHEEEQSDSLAPGEEQYLHAIYQFESGWYEDAINTLDQAMEEGFVNVEVYNYRGRANRELGNMDEAISDFSQAISLDENYFWSWFNRGETFLQWGDHFAAIDDFQTAIDKRADHWSVFFKLGEAYYYTGDHQFRDEALAYLDQAVEMAPEEMLVRRVRADVLAWWFNDLEGALEELNIAVDLTEPGNPDAYISRGAVAKALGLFDLCIDDNNIAFEMTQDNMWIFLNRGDCYAELGDVDMARADYEMTIEMAGDNPEYEWFTSRIHEWLQAH